MTPPRLLSCYFTTPGGVPYWDRLARVLAYTASLHCVGWSLRIEHVTPPVVRYAGGSFIENTHKLSWWYHRVEEAEDGDRLLLIDADTAILRSLDSIWEQPFDFAYTERKASRFPLNGGVIFLRVSERTRAFMEAWVKQNAALLSMQKKIWRQRCGGVNQAALVDLLPTAHHFEVAVRALPCVEWNCEDSAWAAFDPARTRILHIKSDLRRACIKSPSRAQGVEAPTAVWRRLDAEASREARTA